jgi:hypothetical protein
VTATKPLTYLAAADAESENDYDDEGRATHAYDDVDEAPVSNKKKLVRRILTSGKKYRRSTRRLR